MTSICQASLRSSISHEKTLDKRQARRKNEVFELVACICSVTACLGRPGSAWPRHEKAGTSYEAPALTHRSGRSYVPKCDWAESFSLAITFCYLLWFVNLYKYRPINLHPCQVQSRAKKPLTSDKLDDRLACRLYLITCRLYLAAGPRCCWTQPAIKK